ncbi:recombinase XerC [Pseudalkalibacillus caeni]|uniref:Recombinase XerC n=2 Tax=Exobacillus caeni TaxID=2574798 RepID=A0A5R9F9Q6_9BACL|nr:recombinase XerC [Pseudalkalibacillus caeni]
MSSVESFGQWLMDEGKSENTVKTYQGVLEKFLLWLEDHELEDEKLSSQNVQAYIDYLEEQDRSASTVEKVFATISVYARFIKQPEIVENIRRKEKENRRNEAPEFLATDRQKLLLQEVEEEGNLRNTAIVYTLLHTGIRISELCNLNRSDVVISDDKGSLTIRDLDGNEDRIIPLSREVRVHLEKYLESREDNSEILFISSANKRINPRTIQYMLKKYDVSPHLLRHTFCRKLVEKGVDISTVAKLAGHSDINVTKRYLNELPTELEDAINQTFA